MDKKLTDSEIVKALEVWLKKICDSYQTSLDLGEIAISTDTEEYMCLLRGTLDLINRLQAENKDLLYKLTGVMHSVDKWLDGDELKQDEVNRASTMREKTLQIVENLQAENERLNFLLNDAYENNRGLVELLERAKAEAYKEFAERLKKAKQYSIERHENIVPVAVIDWILKELVGEDNG